MNTRIVLCFLTLSISSASALSAQSYRFVFNVEGISEKLVSSPVSIDDRRAAWDDFAVNIVGDASPPASWLSPPDWSYKSLSALPSELYPVDQDGTELAGESVGYIDLNTNSLSNIDSLSSIKVISNSIDLSGNLLTNVNGLSGLVASHNYPILYLNGNQLTDISGLGNLQSFGGRIYLFDNPGLEDLRPLGTASRRSGDNINLRIDNRQYTNRMSIDDTFCQEKINNNFNGVTDSSGATKLPLSYVCVGNNAWEDWVLEMTVGTFVTDFDLMPDWAGYVGMFAGDPINPLPTQGYPSSSVDDLNLSGTGISQIDGLFTITSVLDLNLSGNALTNVNGLSGLTNVGHNNPPSGFSGSINLRNNALTDISGLSQLRFLNGTLSLNGNPSLEDLTPIQNVNHLSDPIVVDNRVYGTRMSSAGDLCTILTGEPEKLVDSVGTQVPVSNVCL